MSMANFHHTLAHALVVDETLTSFVKHCSWENTWSWGEVVNGFALVSLIRHLELFYGLVLLLTAVHYFL